MASGEGPFAGATCCFWRSFPHCFAEQKTSASR
eukprot:CAMPEP_0171096404 /NCGR_PEP_ID=MMETSP0766_2-20121228/44573_2 /TAXON_ID=439317 /ORGANISM="Gambierdiscus australes, Strain CAWD 149" /LENGTH=32 /DNA_ID= /DNA_START= /DNA_END= /DNA_ORIENTATION=